MKQKTKEKPDKNPEKRLQLCVKCRKPIDTKIENSISMRKFMKRICVHNVWFHEVCWEEYNRDKVEEKIKQTYSTGLRFLSQHSRNEGGNSLLQM